MLELLQQVFRQVRGYIHSDAFNRQNVYTHSPDHTTMLFDREAEDIIISGLIESGYSFEIVTEERPPFTSHPAPDYRIVVDPVDGSTNVQHGIMTAAIALAVLPIDAPIIPERVLWSLVGELYSGTVYEASQGNGAFCNGRICQVSQQDHFSRCLIGVNFDGRSSTALKSLLIDEPRPANVRRSGSSAMDVVYIANGAYDAYVDIGDVLTGESYLASASIVLEAGGIITDQYGKPLRPVRTLKDGYSIVAAGSPALHAEILDKLARKSAQSA
ncbi:MAG TPA: inositol monophosphatase family protein [Ktedonobacteraceae bacterium]|nr:inositol monophosphatase family protein [Ktedonobacteraceae bacterium]